ncbi:Hypothetical protein PHPALM_13220 [Phytophthora palmivora]|uniref:Uncharacterized protein n=1 Tax=Phytophthora palmivora TaxID=4796 RepID=A0A2P4XXS5_9STRA|nr:Hypothetical protein PHPALM_13220 [Phytophthora palmivora]
MRLIVTDNYYTSVPLAMQMLTMGCYSIGTVRTDRLVLPASLIGEKKNGEKHKKPPKMRTANIERGTSEIRARQISGFIALRWWGTIDVHDQLRLQSQVTLSYTPRSGGSWDGGCFDITSENSLTRRYTGSSGCLRSQNQARCTLLREPLQDILVHNGGRVHIFRKLLRLQEHHLRNLSGLQLGQEVLRGQFLEVQQC